jgi:hypothetical protein
MTCFTAREAPIAMRLIEDSPTRLVLRESVWSDIEIAFLALLLGLSFIAGAVLLIGNPFWWHLSDLNYFHGHKEPAVTTTIVGCFAGLFGAFWLLGALGLGRAAQTRDYLFDAASGVFSVQDRPLFLPARNADYPFSAIAQISIESRDKSWRVLIQLAGVGPILRVEPLTMKKLLWTVGKDATTVNAAFPHGYRLMPNWDQDRTEQFAGRLRQMVGQPDSRPVLEVSLS